MPLDPTVSPANQAFPAVTSAPSSFAFATPSQVILADVPVAHPSDVLSRPLANIPDYNVSLSSFVDPKTLDYLVMPNAQQSLPTGGDRFSPIVLQIIAWPAANQIQVVQATRGVVIPPLNENILPQGYLASTAPINLLALGQSLLGRQVLAADKPTYLEFEPFMDLGTNPPVKVIPQTTVFADSFAEINGAFVIGITAPDILILSQNFASNPATNMAWIIIDQRLGFEAQSNDFLFQGSYTPESFPLFAIDDAPFLGVSPISLPQSATPPTLPPNPSQHGPLATPFDPSSQTPVFNPNAPQAVPPILVTVNPASQASPGLATNFYP